MFKPYPVPQNQKGSTVKKTLLLTIALTLGLMITAGAALAENLYYVGPQGNQSNGYYVYPYIVTVDGGANQNMMCDAFNRDASPGDSWTATRMLLSDLNDTNVTGLLFGNQGVSAYLAAGYLALEEFNALATNSDPNGYYNWAAWYLFDPTDVTAKLDAGTLSLVQGYLSDAQAAVAGQSPASLPWASNIYIYTPTNQTAQEFLAPVPEPGTLMLLGSGIIGMAGLIRRKFD